MNTELRMHGNSVSAIPTFRKQKTDFCQLSPFLPHDSITVAPRVYCYLNRHTLADVRQAMAIYCAFKRNLLNYEQAFEASEADGVLPMRF